MLIESIFFTILSFIPLVTFEIGEIAFFIVLGIFALAIIIKIIKNKKKKSSS